MRKDWRTDDRISRRVSTKTKKQKTWKSCRPIGGVSFFAFLFFAKLTRNLIGALRLWKIVGKYVVCTLKWLNHIPLWRRRVRTQHAYYDERYACTRVSAKVSNVNARLCLHRGMCSGLLVKCREEQRAFLNQRARATPTFVCSRVRA